MTQDRAAQEQVLLVGYGNELRGDDAVGLHVGRSIEALRLPGVQVHLCPQLTPELAELLAGAKTVVFADAAASGRPGTVELCPLSHRPESASFHHALSPGALVQLCEAAFGHRPDAFILRIHISRCDFGVELSGEAQQGVARAVALFTEFCSVSSMREMRKSFS
ncbi:MAG: hydrogenase maturation protease [Verrucomicrobiota bacterium]|nr:hydrogenase maturation protease [Verrucomicrobiota bacterium]